MARKRSNKAKSATPGRRGRPPLSPRTECAKWLQNRGRTITEFADQLRELAPRFGLTADDVPATKTLTDAVNGRHWPHPKTIMLIRYATDGDVDIEHWVRDLA